MKKIAAINLFVVLALLAGSCATNNNVVSNRLISKRKYTKGFHINNKSRIKGADARENEALAMEETPVSTQKVLPESPVRADKQVRSTDNVASTSRDMDATSEKVQERPESSTFVRTDRKAPSDEAEEKAPLEPVIPSKKELKKDIKNEARHQKQNSQNSGSDSMFILAVIFAILIPPLGVGIYTNIDWLKVLICLLLCVLFWLPGMIYALLVVFDVI